MFKCSRLVIGLLVFSMVLSGSSLFVSRVNAASKNSEKPNVVLFLIDDLGWTDINCRKRDANGDYLSTPTPGGEFDSAYYKTPNIASLRKMGIRFTNAHVFPYCTPTRASLMTGKYPATLKMTGLPDASLIEFGGGIGVRKANNPELNSRGSGKYLLGGYSRRELPLEETTIAEALDDYTSCLVGKWHLCSESSIPSKEAYYPENQGFEYNIGGHYGNITLLWKYSYRWNRMPNFDDPSNYKDWQVSVNYDDFFAELSGGDYAYCNKYGNGNSDYVTNFDYVTDVVTHRALEFIDMETADSKNDPFFLYVPHYAVHTWIDYKAELADEFSDVVDPRGQHGSKEYAAMLRSVDFSVGRIVKYLEEKSLLDNTIIIFLSDNGGVESENAHGCSSYIGYSSPPEQTELTEVSTNYPLKYSKSSQDHGGTRVPMIVYVPKNIYNPGNIYGDFEPSSLVCHEPVHAADIMPTILDYCGKTIPADVEGVSLKSLIDGIASLSQQSHTFKRENGPGDEDDNAIFCFTSHPFTKGALVEGKNQYVPSTASVQKDGYTLYKRYTTDDDYTAGDDDEDDSTFYTWPGDFDSEKMQLSYNPSGVSYELYKTEVIEGEGLDFEWTAEGLKLNGTSSVLVAGDKGVIGNFSRNCTMRIKPEEGNGTLIGWGDVATEGALWRLFLEEENSVVKLKLDLGGTILEDNTIFVDKDNWNYIEVIYNESSSEIYILVQSNLVQSNEREIYRGKVFDVSSNTIDTVENYDVQVGGWNGSEYYKGVISDVSINNGNTIINTCTARWSLDDDVFDGSGNQYDGTISSEPVYEQDGINKCLRFDGIDDYITIDGGSSGNDYSGISGKNPRTVSAWIKLDQIAENDLYTILSWGANVDNNNVSIDGCSWIIQVWGGRLKLGVYGGYIKSVEKLSAGTWHHVAVVLPDKTDPVIADVKLYIDGVPATVDTSNGNQGINTLTSDYVYIGCHVNKRDSNDLYKCFFKGAIDEIRIYDYAIHSSWEMDSTFGRAIPDSSGFGRHGAIVGDISQRNNLYEEYMENDDSTKYGIVNDLKTVLTGWQDSIDAETLRPTAVNSTQNKAYDSINAAIDEADSGDTIVICKGVHKFADSDFKAYEDKDQDGVDDGDGYEPTLTVSKNIKLQSVNPYDPEVVASTILDMDSKYVIEVNSDNLDVTIKGLTLSSSSTIAEPYLIYGNNATGVIENCVLRNSAGGGISNFDGEIINCLIADNGGIGLETCQSNIINCTIVNNSDYGISNSLGGNVYNTILWGNDYQGNDYQIGGSYPELSYSCIQGWVDGGTYNSVGTYNIADDPLFISESEYNYRLQSDSPCVDKGNDSIVSDLDFDLDGNSRKIDGDSDSIVMPDMGAYEFFDIVAYWHNESDISVIDQSVFGHDGTIFGVPCLAVGVIGNCLDFDGVDDYVEIEGYQGIGGSNSRTVSAYIKAAEDLGNSDNSMHTILSWGKTESNQRWQLMLDDSSGQLALATYGGRLKGGPDLEDGYWHHVAAVLPEGADNLNQVKLYVDGVEIVTNSSTLDEEISTALFNNVMMGAVNIGSEEYPDIKHFFDGCIDEVLIYNIALTDSAVAELADDVIEAFYQFDGDASDWSDNAYDGTIVGGPSFTVGAIGNCLDFDGVDDCVEIEGYQGIGGSNSRTVSAYIKAAEDLSNSDNSMHTIVSWGNTASAERWQLMLDETTGQLALAIYAGRLKGGPDLEDGSWHHVAAVLPEGADNLNQVKLYVDGVEISTNSGDLDSTIDTALLNNVLIGAVNIGSEEYPDIKHFFDGCIDELRVYKVALNQNTINGF